VVSELSTGDERPRRRLRWVLPFLIAGVAGCSHHQPPVAVPEQQFRSEEQAADRLRLPLSPEGRRVLTAFLRAACNRDDVGVNLVDPEAEARYRSLLDRLAAPSGLSVDDLGDGAAFRSHFKGKPQRRIVDAREEAPVRPLPYALTDGRYWWIFFPDGPKLTGLLVCKGVGTRLDE